MEAEEGGESLDNVLIKRKRSESNGGNSDSDLSDGWNFIDHTDVPSSDGESVEVIGTDEESQDIGRNMVVDLNTPLERSVTSVTHSQATEEQPPLREEMFDSSFCWFLFFAAGTVLVSNLTFMAAENFFAWDIGYPTDSPSFLRDLPTTPKQIQSVDSKYKISWADNEEAKVETVDSKSGDNADDVREDFNMMERKTEEYKTYKGSEEKEKKRIPSSNEKKNILDHLKMLSNAAGTSEAKEKLNQALFILDALQIGLNELEDGIGDSSELNGVLNNQKTKIIDTIDEVYFGVLRSLEKMANNVLNKVQKLERKFENQWCKLEKNGYKEVFNGLFYDCQDIDGRKNKKSEIHKKEKNKNREKHNQKDHIAINSYQFEVDRDSTGKAYNMPKSKSGEINDYYNLVKNENLHNKKKYDEAKKNRKESDPTKGSRTEKNNLKWKQEEEPNTENMKRKVKGEFKRLYKNENDQEITPEHLEENNKNTYTQENLNVDNSNQYYDIYSKEVQGMKVNEDLNNDYEIYKKQDDHSKRHNEKMKNNFKKNNHNKNKQHIENKKDKKENYSESEEHNYKKPKHKDNVAWKQHLNKDESKKVKNDHPPKKEEENNKIDKSTIEMVSKYLKENCQKNSNKNEKIDNIPGEYFRLKEGIENQLRIPKHLFDNLYFQYCKTNSGKANHDEFHKNYHKDDFMEKTNKKRDLFSNNGVVIENSDSILKNVMNVRVIESLEENSEDFSLPTEVNDKVISPPRKGIQQWEFSYEEPSSNNKSSVKGDWFIKAGQSRAKARWSQSRGDWWFERATHRRKNPTIPSWFSDSHKNWQFLRAWARQRCRQRPQDGWCSFPQGEQFPNQYYNFR